MSATPSGEDLVRQIEDQKAEIAKLTEELAATAARIKLHTKRVMKQGMDAFFSGKAHNPYDPASDDAELWTFGYNLSRDNWNDMRGPDGETKAMTAS